MRSRKQDGGSAPANTNRRPRNCFSPPSVAPAVHQEGRRLALLVEAMNARVRRGLPPLPGLEAETADE
jgi:hypothetical protein